MSGRDDRDVAPFDSRLEQEEEEIKAVRNMILDEERKLGTPKDMWAQSKDTENQIGQAA